MRNNELTVIRKLGIADIANETGKICGTARSSKFNLTKFEKQIKEFAEKFRENYLLLKKRKYNIRKWKMNCMVGLLIEGNRS